MLAAIHEHSAADSSTHDSWSDSIDHLLDKVCGLDAFEGQEQHSLTMVDLILSAEDTNRDSFAKDSDAIEEMECALAIYPRLLSLGFSAEVLASATSTVEIAPTTTPISQTMVEPPLDKRSGSPRNVFVGKRWTSDQDQQLRDAVAQLGIEQWTDVVERVNGRNSQQCRQRWRKIGNAQRKTGSWSASEDATLIKLMQEHMKGRTGNNIGPDWNYLDACMPWRTSRQLQYRWSMHLNPNVNSAPFTEQEISTLLRLRKSQGRNWSNMAAALPGRTPNMIKCFFLRRETKHKQQKRALEHGKGHNERQTKHQRRC